MTSMTLDDLEWL